MFCHKVKIRISKKQIYAKTVQTIIKQSAQPSATRSNKKSFQYRYRLGGSGAVSCEGCTGPIGESDLISGWPGVDDTWVMRNRWFISASSELIGRSSSHGMGSPLIDWK